MKLHVNGDLMERPEGESLAGLLTALGVAQDRVATLVNEDVVPAAGRAARRLAAGDHVEILTFAGGG